MAVLLLLPALLLPASLTAGEPEEREDEETRPLRFVDDLGAPVSGLEVCFWRGPDRACHRPEAGAELPWPEEATAVRVEGPEHGPVWLDATDPGGPVAPPADGVVVVPRKAELILVGVPAGVRLDFHRAGDPVFREPLERLRVVDPGRPVKAPSGAMVLAIASPGHAPDLHRLNTPPGGRAEVRHAPRPGWSAIVRTTDAHRRRHLPGPWVRLLEASPTAPADPHRILATVRAGDHGLTLLSGIEAPMAVVEASHPDFAPRAARGLIAPAGGLVYQELPMWPGGTVEARVRWLGEPAPGAACELFEEPLGPLDEARLRDPIARARADGAGRCRFEHAPEGRHLLRVRPPGAEARVDLPVEVEDRRVSELTVDLAPRTIRGTVSRGDAPAVGYRLQVRSAWPATAGDDGRPGLSPSAQAQATTDEQGEYELTVLTTGRFALAVWDPLGTWVATRSVELAAAGAREDFHLLAKAVTGRVVSARGGAVAGAEVSLPWQEAGGFIVGHTTTSRANGSFEIPLTTPGQGRVRAVKDGFAPAIAEVAVGEEDLPSTAELVLEPLDRVQGRVVSGDGSPLPGVWLASALEAGASLAYVGSAVSGPDGTFELPAQARYAGFARDHPMRIYASGPGCPLVEAALPAPEWPPGGVPEGEVKRAEVVIRCDVEPAVLRLHLAFSASHALAGETLLLRREKDLAIPREVLEGHLRNFGLPVVTGLEGGLLVVLAPGRWEALRAKRVTAGPLEELEAVERAPLLGGTALDPRTVTDLYLGAGER